MLATHFNKEMSINDIEDIYNIGTKLNVDEFSIWESIPNIQNRTPNDKSSIKKILDFQISKNSIQNCNIGPKVFTNIKFEKILGQMSGKKWIHIDIDGNVHPDPYIPISYGNLKHLSLVECWNNIISDKEISRFKFIHPLYNDFYFEKVYYKRKME